MTAQAIRRARLVPDEIEFVDEDGNALPEYGKLNLPFWDKVTVARLSLRWKQSIDTTLERMMLKALRDYVRSHASVHP